MNQNITTYLIENKEQYSKDTLVAELRKSGYEEGDIAESIAHVFGENGATLVGGKTSFWNFKDKKVYTTPGQKWADFLFGFFAANIFWSLSMMVFGVGHISRIRWMPFLLTIAIATYLFNRRRSVSYGIVTSMVILPLIVAFVLVGIFGIVGFN